MRGMFLLFQSSQKLEWFPHGGGRRGSNKRPGTGGPHVADFGKGSTGFMGTRGDSEEIRGVQQNDEELAIVVKWMEGGEGEVTDENVLAMGSPAMKFYWVNKNLMKFKDTILMYTKGDKDLILTPGGWSNQS